MQAYRHFPVEISLRNVNFVFDFEKVLEAKRDAVLSIY